MSPGNQLLRHGMHNKPPTPQTNPHHLMIQPPNMGHHPSTLGKILSLKVYSIWKIRISGKVRSGKCERVNF